MSPLEYIAQAFDEWPRYIALAVLFLGLHWILIKRWAVGVYDPLFLLLVSNAFGWAIVWFMYLRGDIAALYLASFTSAQLALYAGLHFGTRWSARPPAFARVPQRPDRASASLTLVLAALVHVGATLAVWRIAGIPLFRESRLGAFEGSGGFGILERLVDSSGPIAVFCAIYLVLHRGTVSRPWLPYAFMAWFVASMVVSGSKSALLAVVQYVLSIVFVYSGLRHQPGRFWGGHRGKLLIVASVVFAVGVLGLQYEGDMATAAVAFAYRVVSFGDVYVFAYPEATIESLQGKNPLVGMFGGFLSTFRLFPQDAIYPNLGFQFTAIAFPDLDLIVGPNPQHPIFGYHYFGPFAFVFSFVLGAVTAAAQGAFFRRGRPGFFGGLLALMAYFSLVGISIDFEYTLSKLASMIIGLALIVLPVLLLRPAAVIGRHRHCPALQREVAATGVTSRD